MNKPQQYDYDLFVIGAGSGGVRASRIAASHGARVAICEENRVGGTCVIRGCVPKKLMSYAAHFAEDFEDAVGFGWSVQDVAFDWQTFIQRKDAEIDRLNQIYLKLLSNSRVSLYKGRGVVLDEHSVEVDGQTFTAEKILVAVGGTPMMPDIPGIEWATSSDDAFYYEELPEKILVVGGGYIAVEFAGIFNALGSEVSLVYRGDQILRGFDADVRRSLAQEMAKKGIKIYCHTEIESIIQENSHQKNSHQKNSQLTATLNNGDLFQADQILYATGRKPKTEGLGLERAAVYLKENGEIPVDHNSRTNIASIFAVGDVTGRIGLTPVAIREGHAFADTFFGVKEWVVDHENVASAVFSQPPVASVGLSEGDAHTLQEDIDVYISEFKPMKHTLSGRDEKTMMKLVVCRQTDRVLGCHMVGLDAPEMMQGLAIGMKCGMTKAQLDATIGIHPTAAEEWVTMRTPTRTGR